MSGLPKYPERDDLVHDRDRLRSPMVLTCIDDYLAGRRYPLEIVRALGPMPAPESRARAG